MTDRLTYQGGIWILLAAITLSGLAAFAADAPATRPIVLVNGVGGDRLLDRVEFKEAPLQDAAHLLAAQTGLNIVCSADSAKTKVTLFLQNISTHAAIEELCKAHNLSCRFDDTTGVVRIATVEEFQRNLTSFREQQTKVFTLLYPNSLDVAVSIRDLFGDRVQLSLGKEDLVDDIRDLRDRFDRFDLIDQRSQGLGLFEAGGTTITGGGGGSSGFSSSQSGGFGRSSSNQQRSGLYRPNLNNNGTDPGDDYRRMTAEQANRIARNLESGPPSPDQQAVLDAYRRRQASIYVTVIRRNNMVVVRSSDPQTMDEISALVERLDVPTPLVLLEVKVLSIDLTDGFNSAFDVQFGDGKTISGGFSSGNILPPASDLLSGNARLNAPLIPGGTGVQPNAAIFQVVSDSFRARLQMLETKNRITQLAAPVLLTANNEVSRLFVGEERPIVRNVSSQTIVNNNNVTSVPNTTIEFRPVGTTLLLTPSINADRTVTLRLLQENSRILSGAASIPVIAGDGSVQQIPVDVVSARTLSGTVVAKDSLMLAVGGLIQEQVNDQRDEVPILGRIPILGILFRRQNTGRSRQELVILIRPYILNTPAESEAISKKLVRELSIHPNARKFEGTMGSFEKEEVPRPRPSTNPTDRLFRFHSVQPEDY